MRIKIGEPIDLRTNKRYVQHARDHAMGDVYDALVELITNADDSYGRLFHAGKRNRDGGDILIEHLEQRKGQPSLIIVRDKAEGMDSKKMIAALYEIGAASSESGDRGYMGRGAKDCSALGNVVFESIKDDRYYRCKITHDLKFVLEVDGKTAGKTERSQLGITHGNGTSVTVELIGNARLPRLDTLAAELPWHFALRDITGEASSSRVLLRQFSGNGAKPIAVVYHPPEGTLVLNEEFEVEGYDGTKARLKLWRADEPLEDTSARFERSGILIKSTRAIHECSLLSDEFKKNPYARHYFGRLECSYIDRLLDEYERDRAQGNQHPEKNPRLVIDPNRRYGLERRHPFVQKLLQLPTERLRALLAKDKERDTAKQRQIANKETVTRLDRLAKLAGRFLRRQLDELQELGVGEAVDNDMFAKQGALIYPTYLNVAIGNERTLTVYVKKSLLHGGNPAVAIQSDPGDSVEILGSPFTLHQHRSKEDRLLGSFRVKGQKVSDTVVVSAHCDGLSPPEALVQVVENSIDERIFFSPVEFEREQYAVRVGSVKTIRLFAKCPEVIAEETEILVHSLDTMKVTVRGKCHLIPVVGSNYAEAVIKVEGRVLHSKTTLKVEINGRTASTLVRVIDKSDEDRNIPVKIEIRDEDYGNFRARWADHEGKPNLLWIFSFPSG